MRRDLHPHGRAIDAPEAKQVVGDRPFRAETIDKGRAGLRIHEPRRVEGAHLPIGCFCSVAEDQLEMGIGGDGRACAPPEEPDVDAFVDGLEQTEKDFGSRFGHACCCYRAAAGGRGVGVIDPGGAF